jgi:hypothetical protein
MKGSSAKMKKIPKKKKTIVKKHWYWNESCQCVEKASDRDIKAGRVKRCKSADELKKDLCK